MCQYLKTKVTDLSALMAKVSEVGLEVCRGPTHPCVETFKNCPQSQSSHKDAFISESISAFGHVR